MLSSLPSSSSQLAPGRLAGPKTSPSAFSPLPARLTARRLVQQPSSSSQVVRASAASPSPAEQGGKQRYAFLHDFCMTIPYGGAMLILGAISFIPALHIGPIVGGGLLAAGSTMVMLSILSLRYWKQGRSSKNFTLIGSGVSALCTYWMYQRFVIGLTPVYSAALAAVSAAMALFLAYNIFAGGNPPKGVMSH